jgi:hypothetical protein
MNSLQIEENEVANINKTFSKLNDKSSSIRNRKCSNINCCRLSLLTEYASSAEAVLSSEKRISASKLK